MALIPQEEIKNIRNSVNIVDIISSYIPLDHKGKNYFGVCPFHEDHSPSMSVSEEKQIYKCFSCGAAGNVFTFVQNYENISFLEAVELVATKAGIPLSKNISSYKKEDKNSKYYEMNDIASKFFINNLKTTYGTDAISYLKDRGLNKEDIKDFDIGLALSEKDLLYKLLKSKKYEDNDMKLLSLIDDSEYIHDSFINRIMFPLHDENGKIIGFSGRIYNNESGPKYLNTKETVLFKKGKMLFNYHRAKKYIRNTKSVILVEGYMDAIRLYINGIKNVVAIMGTALTKEQIALLKKLNCKIILSLDNDDPGQKAIYTIGATLKELNFDVGVIALGDSKDPDEYILKHGVEAFINNLKSPVSYIDFSLNYLKNNKNLNETADLAKYINDVLNDMAKEEDEIVVDITLKKLASDYNLEYDVLKNKIKNLNKDKAEIKPFEKKEVTSKSSRYDIAAKSILYYMMNDSKYVRVFKNNLIFLDNVNYREISKEIIYYYDTNKDINLADFLSFANSNERFYPVILDIINTVGTFELNESIFNDYLDTIKSENEKKTIKELKESLKKEMDKNKKIEIATKIAKIKKGSV